MENYQVALSPDLGLSPADFVAAWNEDAEARTNGETRLATSTGKVYFDAALANEIVLSLTRISLRFREHSLLVGKGYEKI